MSYVDAALRHAEEMEAEMKIGDLEEHQIMQAIRDGVADAIWRIATNATDMPCADFYAAIAKGAEEGVYRTGGADE